MVRHAGRAFKSLVFIALNPTGPSLPLYGPAVDDDSLTEDIDSTAGMDSGGSDADVDPVCFPCLS